MFPLSSITRRCLLWLAPVFVLVAFAATLPTAAIAGPGTPPVVTILGYPASNSTAGTFVFTADEPVEKYECQFNGVGLYTECVSPTFVNGLSEGSTYEFRVRATDTEAGETGSSALYTWTVDLTPPAAPALVVPTNGTWTNDDTPTISGTAEEDTQVLIFDDGLQIGSTISNSSGDWNFTPSTGLNDGTYLIRARARDAAGNMSPYTAARTLNVDTVAPSAPAISSPTEGELTNGEDLLFAGSTEAHATVSVLVDGLPFADVTANGSGNWSLNPSTAPDDGARTVAAFATDRAGNIGAPTSTVNFDLETVAPAPPTIDLPVDGTEQASSSVQFSGTAEADGAVKLFRNGIEFGETIADASGDWQLTDDLADGVSFSVTATTTDVHGNESVESAAVQLTIDTTAPSTTITSSPAPRTNQTTALFELQSDDSGATFECLFDSQDWLDAEGCPELAGQTGLAAGNHTFTARATDPFGNVGSPADEFSWVIDLDEPPAPLITSPNSPFGSNNARPLIVGTAEASSTVELFADAQSIGTTVASPADGSWDFTPGSDLAQGAQQITAVSTDEAGNEGLPSEELALTIDSVPPVASITDGPGSFTPIPSARFTFTGNEAGLSYQCRVDLGLWATCANPFVVEPSSFGPHAFEVRAIDSFGNVETAPKQYVWRLVQVTSDLPPNRCRFRGGRLGSSGKLRRVKVVNRAKGIKRVSFRSTKSGIAIVAVTRGKRVLVQRAIAMRAGANVLSLRTTSRRLGVGKRSVVIDTVADQGGRGTFKSPASVARNGVLRLSGKPRTSADVCRLTRGTKRAKATVSSIRRSGNSLTLSITSNQLVIAALRVEDRTARTNGPIVLVRPGRITRASIEMLPGTGADGGPTILHLTAFNAGFRQTNVAIGVPPAT